ncbi:MAG: hypothetical protein ACD_62C00395G0017 [uncultured bacterium]|nr:MAG: hypothetical protein ACD_62C00395G0017 [uncultured bacterium]HLD43994.1 M17 family peptidase N-terminal domain-containing protein [bacterium]
MKLSFTSQKIDKIPSEIVVLMLYENDIPFKGILGVLDWRINGRLSEFFKREKFRGKAKELLLIPSESRFKSQEMLVMGLGKKELFEKDHISQVLDYFLDTIEKKKMKQVCFSLSQLFESHFDWRNAVRLLLSKLVDCDSIEEVVLCEPEELINEARRRQIQFGPNIEVVYHG